MYRYLILFFTLIQLVEAKTQPVEFVDIERYMGEWYEIVSLPQSFTEGCFCTRAKYEIKKNKKVSVLNTCNKKSVSGKLTEAIGTAKVVNAPKNSELKVTFFWPFFGDYWIIGLNEDYSIAIVSNRDGSSLWVLARTPQISDDELKSSLEIAKNQGIDISKIKYTEQKGCSYP